MILCRRLLKYKMKKYNQTTSFSGEMVKYYDQFFNIENEAPKHIECMKKTLGNSWNTINNVLDIGCGTGKHANILSTMGKNVTGLDLSEDMIAFATEHHSNPNCTFLVDNMCKHQSEQLYDMAYAMSHVIGYQLNNQDLEDFLKAVYNSLAKDGCFYFNFYHEAGLYNSEQSARRNFVKGSDVNITRFSNASINAMENCLDLEYFYLIEKNNSDEVTEIAISEKMRFFSVLELKYYLEKIGFKVEKVVDFRTNENLDKKHWNAVILARK